MSTIGRKLRSYLLLKKGVFAILLLLFLVALLGYLALKTRVQWDVSQNGRNSLSQASIEILQKLNGPVKVTAYATKQHVEFGDIRQVISNFVLLYQRAKPDLMLTFIDPAEQPELARAAGVSVNGEMVITFNDKREYLTVINEQAFTNVLMRLARSGEKRIMGLTGHGERKLDGDANYDLGEFGRQLLANGFKSQALNLVMESDIPSAISTLIIASPQTDLMEGEVAKLLAYVEQGGNLLWLVDQESLRGLLPLAEKLHLMLIPGVVVDPRAKQLNAPITFALGASYGRHPITDHFDYITVFPFARQITVNESEDWKNISLVEVAQHGWVESDELDHDISFDPMHDVAGPISIAVALTRIVEDREQRIVVVGSGHFLANTYLGNGNNLDFGINLINWLAGDENLIAIQPRATHDRSLVLSESMLTVLVVGFLIVLPLLFLVSGIYIWWRRNR